ncbi:hypothetical protein H2199_004241 [Coniosporium tulheliwenetii]|uniref:Uncharacterized protein n=1 Tax=Coniosporium tulheliwenetii TaxID=3383036 RepID=A0ACC2Z8A5_9PEZI|nr:hypothetical protein H2199_004241 [Cladosporium sp. JES 115]
MDYETEPRAYDDEPRGYDRDRSRSPRPDRRGDDGSRARSASPNGRDRMSNRGPPPEPRADDDEEGARNPGSNLFVTGIHPRLTEEEVSRLFEKYGDVEKCNIMRDPHTRESRGFGFVKMVTPEQADAAKEGLQGEVYEGRTLSIEKARRARPRTPTPGKYFGPPKRESEEFGGRPPRGGRYGGDRYDDRRGGGYGGRRDDYRGSRYGGDRHDDRGYGRRDRDDYAPRGVDRYASSGREDRYSSRNEDRRGGGGGYGYDREDRGGADRGGAGGYPEKDTYGGGRSYDDRGE